MNPDQTTEKLVPKKFKEGRKEGRKKLIKMKWKNPSTRRNELFITNEWAGTLGFPPKIDIFKPGEDCNATSL